MNLDFACLLPIHVVHPSMYQCEQINDGGGGGDDDDDDDDVYQCELCFMSSSYAYQMSLSH